ncbi:MAG: ferredoxin [Epsilonproteobacteria bacterium]|nr:ferredoxin [Campylobacterota bacterium]NPA64933.1 ferredoxin [Campylobacterota bacterium]
MLKLEGSRCVRYYSKLSGCDRCQAICPEDAIKTQEGGVAIWQQECIECGACVGVCPTEALALSSLNVTEFVFELLKSEDDIIGCRYNFVCLAGLSVEYLIALGLVKDITLDIGHCAECEIKESCFPVIEHNIAQANYVLGAIGAKTIEAKELRKMKENAPDRREFFNLFTLQGAMRAKEELHEEMKALEDPSIALSDSEAKAIRDKTIPNKRKLLFMLLKRFPKPQEYKYLENEHLTFVSDKEIDHTCDNCSICYRICPTEALSTTKRGDKILFDAMLCVRCHLCHDVCEKQSIKLSQYFDTKELFEPEQKVLAAFSMVRCEDCGALYTYFGEEEMLCPRCRIEEEEAKSLWGIE